MLLRVTKSITESFNRCIEKVIVALDEKLTTKIDAQNSELFNTNKRIDSLEKQLSDMQAVNADLRDSLKVVLSRQDASVASVDDLEQYSRSDNLIICDIPLPTDGSRESDVRQLVVDVMSFRRTPSASPIASLLPSNQRLQDLRPLHPSLLR